MPKSQYMDPNALRQPGQIEFQPIPVNQYNKTIADEKKNFSKEDFVRIYHDMAVIREFETMLFEIKTKSNYNGVEYMNPGPAHLSMGQEAAAVGQAYLLTVDDYIFGSHRSHGEILAKGMSAIHKLSDEDLYNSMKNFMDGRILKIVEDNVKTSSVKELAHYFLAYGALAEIMAREPGFHKGLGGSMHAFFLPFGIYPNNAIVGGSATIAAGAALFKKVNQKNGICISNLGDGSVGRGPVWEAMMFSAMDQMTKLWEEAYRGGLPVLFNFNNNLYGMGGQTCGETMAYGILARIGAGINPAQMHSERVDGYNPLAVIDAMRRKIALLKNHEGPVLMDTLTYRYTGHSPSDSGSYRTPEEVAAWKEHDSLENYSEKLVSAKIAPKTQFEEINGEVRDFITTVCKMAVDETISPRMDLVATPDAIESIMFSNQSVEKMEDRPVEVNMPMEECPRVQAIAKKERWGFDANGKPVSKNKVFQVRDALFEAIIDRFYKDPTLISYGEDVRDWGGAYAVYRGLTEALPYHRMFNSPISESAIVGTAVGYAMAGGRAIVELMYCDFLGCAGDEIFNQLAKWQSMSAGLLKMPVVLRVSVGSKYGAQHSQDWSSLIAHIPGLKAVFPVTPYDAKGLMNAALNGTDPVIFFESQRVYDFGEQFHEGGVPKEYYEIPLGEPDIKRQGSDITILTIGATLYKAMEAAKILQEKYNISAEVIDARSIVPFNYEKVIESVKKTGRILLASDAVERNSVLKDMAEKITELAFDYLDAPPVVVGSRNWITPAHELEKHFFPQEDWIIDAIHERIMPIEGYVATNNFTDNEMLRRTRLGV